MVNTKLQDRVYVSDEVLLYLLICLGVWVKAWKMIDFQKPRL